MYVHVTGVITTVSLPVYKESQFLGVAGVDVLLSDLYTETVDYQRDWKTYTFVVNRDGYR